MFTFQRTRSNSTSSTSSTLSLSPAGWSPSRSTLSPPTTTTSPSNGVDYFSLNALRPSSSRRSSSSSLTTPHSFPDTHLHHACAYPSWPARASLSASSVDIATPASPSAYEPYQPASSRISDEDLEELDFSAPAGAELGALGDGMGLGISWSAVGNVAPVVERQQQQTRRRLPPPPTEMQMNGAKRRRSSSRGTKRKVHVKLGAIAE